MVKPFQPRSKINSGMPCKPNAQPNKWPWMPNAPGPKLNVQLNWFARTAVSVHRSTTLAKATVPAARAAAAFSVVAVTMLEIARDRRHVQDMYGINGLEMHEGPHNPLELSSVSPGKVAPHQGMLDCGATASAGPEASVQRLIEAVLRQDKSATVTVDPNQRPHFRYGSGRWGRAQYRVTLQSELSGHPRVFHVYALPNPPEFFEQWFTTDMLVPILVGMSHAGSDGVGMVVDLATGFAIDALLPDPRPYQLDKNHKGHFMVDLVHFLTGGNQNSSADDHPVVKVTSRTPTSSTGKPWDMHTRFPCEMYDMNVKVGTCSQLDPLVNTTTPHGPSRVCELYAWKLMREHRTVPAWLISALDSSESMGSVL